jgi:AcrR family transcriptional regulator
MPKTKTSLEDKIAAAALRLAADHAWRSLTLAQIAKAAKVPLAEAHKHFADKDQILSAVVFYIDKKVAASVGKPLSQGTPKDRLFEVMMARIDILQKNRHAILGIMAALRQNPALAQFLIPAHMQAIKKMLSLAGIPTHKVRQPLVIGGLLTIYGLTLCRWQSDITPDLSKTMAALDRSLRMAEKAAEILLRPI